VTHTQGGDTVDVVITLEQRVGMPLPFRSAQAQLRLDDLARFQAYAPTADDPDDEIFRDGTLYWCRTASEAILLRAWQIAMHHRSVLLWDLHQAERSSRQDAHVVLTSEPWARRKTETVAAELAANTTADEALLPIEPQVASLLQVTAVRGEHFADAQTPHRFDQRSGGEDPYDQVFRDGTLFWCKTEMDATLLHAWHVAAGNRAVMLWDRLEALDEEFGDPYAVLTSEPWPL
jgi:hypothetical protein